MRKDVQTVAKAKSRPQTKAVSAKAIHQSSRAKTPRATSPKKTTLLKRASAKPVAAKPAVPAKVATRNPKKTTSSVASVLAVAPVTPQAAFGVLKSQCRPGSLVFAIYEHAERVARYAMTLFKDLEQMHRLEAVWRTRLLWAAYLHDITVQEGTKGHHKAAKKRILEDKTLPIPEADRPYVALLARFHRKAIPTMKHRELMTLPNEVRRQMIAAASLLRLADGLDYRHQGAVQTLHAKFVDGVASIVVSGEKGIKAEIERAKKKVKGLLDGRVVFAAEELGKKQKISGKSRPGKKAQAGVKKS